MNESIAKPAPKLRLLVLSALVSVLWLYSICIFQYAFWRGGDLSGHDFGLGTLVPAWLFSIIWSAAACFPLARALFGRFSIYGFVIGGVISIPGMLLIAAFSSYFAEANAFFSAIFGLVFNVLTLGGLIPEGRPGTAEFLGLCWAGICIGTFFGLTRTYGVSTHARV